MPFALTQEAPAAAWSLDLHEQKAALADQHPGTALRVRGFVRLKPTQRIIKSNKVIGLDGHVKSETLRDRWDKARRSGLGVWFTRVGPPGGPHVLPIFNNKGPRAARHLEVDLVHKPGTGQAGAQPEFVARRRIVRRNKTWMLPIPDSAYEGEKEFRIRYRTLRKRREGRSSVPDRSVLEAAALKQAGVDADDAHPRETSNDSASSTDDDEGPPTPEGI